MPWEKSFDVDDVLDRATDVFWAKGYEAASMSDLLKATGINKGSLYNAFGSKKALFTQALLRYDRTQRQASFAGLRKLDDPVAAVTGLFDLLIEQCVSDADHKGCLLVNTALDLPNHDDDIEKIVKAGLDDIESFFRQQLELGKSRGVVPATTDTNKTSKGLLALVIGLRVLSRGAFDEQGLRSIKEQAIDLIS